MTDTESGTERVRRTDAALGRHGDFADPTAIRRRGLARYRLGLTVLAARDPVNAAALELAGGLDDTNLLPLLLDPVLRNAFEDELTRLENGIEISRAFGDLLARFPVGDAAGTGPCERLMRPSVHAWPVHGPTWLWTEIDDGPAPDPVYRARLEGLFVATFSAAARGVPVTDEMILALRRGADLLCDLLPISGAGVFPHIATVGFATDERPDGPLLSVSGGDPLPSAIFMAPSRLTDPWETAEILFHEGLHLKLFDVSRSGSLVVEPDRQVTIPWRTSNWTLVRVLFALHVYSHLLLFRAAATDAGERLAARYGPPPRSAAVDRPTPGSPAARDGTYLTVLDRARYLAEQAEAIHGGCLTAQGSRFVGWLLDAIETIEPGLRTWPKPSHDHVPPRNQIVATRYRRVEPATSVALPDLGQLLVMTEAEPKARWLNARAWLVYALCDGQDIDTVESEYRRHLLDAGQEADDSAAQVRAGLRDLADTGLVTPVP
ncbi:aKG-HExxH-type peptide beta-hydroxylase [Actinomadura sp. 3N407]|uniref:aKG-HExxH-type peptide beta-hydroxylase n=1 Tax=Actinomadura sp. 3N407 TaxID=3457423 RepID=UPI003FCE6B42